MGPGLMALVGAGISATTVGVAIGVAVVTSSPALVASTTPRTVVVARTPAAANGTAPLTVDMTKLGPGIAHLAADVLATAAAPDPTLSPGVFDTAATADGFATSGYSFTMRITNLPGLTALGAVVRGTVTDATHFILEFPGSPTLTRYERRGDTAFATLSGQVLEVVPGQGAFGDLSPEDLMPGSVWSAVVAPWASTLQRTDTPGVYTAPSRALGAAAKRGGYLGKDWQLGAQIDATGRLVQVTYAGTIQDEPFGLDIAVAYN
jgi:hypothetical protein